MGGIRWYRRGQTGQDWHGPKFSANQYYHFQVQRLGNTACFFVDGEQKSCWSEPRANRLGACNTDEYDVKLGGLWDWDHQPQIHIDEFKIFKRAVRDNQDNFRIVRRDTQMNNPPALSEPEGTRMGVCSVLYVVS